MKKNEFKGVKNAMLLSIICILKINSIVSAQVNYVYDNAGNRAQRYEVSPPIMKPNNSNTTKDIQAENLAKTYGLTVYPNPSVNAVNVNLTSFDSIKTATISVYSLDGKVLYSKEVTSVPAPIDISSYAEGVYFIKVLFGKTELFYRIAKYTRAGN